MRRHIRVGNRWSFIYYLLRYTNKCDTCRSLSFIGSYRVSEEETCVLAAFLGESVRPSSGKTYKPSWEKWLGYLDSLNPQSNPGELFQRIPNSQGRATRLAMYYHYLHKELNLREEQISAASTGLKYFLECKGVDTSFFGAIAASRGRKASKRTIIEKSLYEEEKLKKSILPIGLDIILELRRVLWEETDWNSKEGADSKGIWIATGLGYDSGDRVSNVTLKDGPTASDHCIRARQVNLEVLNKLTGDTNVVVGGEAFRDHVKGIDFSVTSITLDYLTSKTAHKKAILNVDNEGDSLLINDLVEWILRSGVLGCDELTTRYFDGKRKVITSQSVRSAIKTCCISFGLNPDKFSTKSLRSGFTTQYAVSGANKVERNAQGGWKKGSVIPDKHYNFHIPRGALSLGVSTGKFLSVSDMAKLAPNARNGSVSSSVNLTSGRVTPKR
jgi:hypothetical protein